MSVDRSRFRKTKVSKLKEQESKAQESQGANRFGPSLRRINKLEEGSHKFRIMPMHPDAPEEIGSYFQQCSIHFLPFEVKDDKTGKVEIKNRPVFNSKIHGKNTKNKDLIDEYISLVKKVVHDRCQDADEVEKQLYPINGFYSPDASKRVNGIKMQTTWEMYVIDLLKDEDEIAQFSCKASVRNQLNEIAEDEAADDPMGGEPFSDPDDGLPITVKFDNSQQGADKYKVRIPRSEDPYPLTDDMLEKLQGLPSLESKYCGSYTRRDFELAYQGLELFDERNDYDIFDMDEWHDIVDNIQTLYPVEDDESPESNEEEVNPLTGEVEDNDRPTSIYDMNREELKAYIKSNKLGIRVLGKHTEDDIRDMIDDVLHGPDDDDLMADDDIQITEKPKRKRSFRDRKQAS